MFRIIWFLLLSALHSVYACSVTGSVNDISASFTNVAYPSTLTLSNTYSFIETGSTCYGENFTAYETIFVLGTPHYAVAYVVTSASTPVTYVAEFPDLTMTSLTSAGGEISWSATWVGAIGGGGTGTILLPVYTTVTAPLTTSTPIAYTSSTPTITKSSITTASTSSPTVTLNFQTFISTTSSTSSATPSSGLSKGAIGGIVGGVVGGLLLLALLLFCFCFFGRRRRPVSRGQVVIGAPAEEKNVENTAVPAPQPPVEDFGEALSGRVHGDY